MDFMDLANPAMLKLRPYQTAKSVAEVSRTLGLSRITALGSNENPLGTSECVRQHLIRECANVARYPDANAVALKKALSEHLKVLPEQLIVGNGSEEVLKNLIQALVRADAQIIIPQYSFAAYEVLAKGFGIQVCEVPSPHYKISVEAILKAVTAKTRMIILANPNNPTGTYFNEVELLSLLEELPSHVILVYDEAYAEYVTQSDYPRAIEKIKTYENLVVIRTFSKVYGLAGLRVGYGVAQPSLIEWLERVRQPFNLNHLGMSAGVLALQDQNFIKKSLDVNEKGKKQLYCGLREQGLCYVPTEGNFMMVETPQRCLNGFEALLQQGVIVRPLAPYGLPHMIRVTIGVESENDHFLEAMKTISEE